MTVTNPGSRILDKVQLTLTIEIPHSAFEHNDTDDLEPLPDPPEPSKTKSLVDYGFLGSTPHLLTGLSLWQPPTFQLPDLGIDIEGSQITLNVGQLRPEKTVTSTDFHLLLHERPVDNQLTISWTLTSTSAEGVQRGAMQMPVHPTQGVFLDAQLDPPEDETD